MSKPIRAISYIIGIIGVLLVFYGIYRVIPLHLPNFFLGESYVWVGLGLLVLAGIMEAIDVRREKNTRKIGLTSQPINSIEIPLPPPPPNTSKPENESKKTSTVEKEVHIIEKYYRYSVTCPYCQSVYDDRFTQCPKCGATHPKNP
jgi:hypothetical protein